MILWGLVGVVTALVVAVTILTVARAQASVDQQQQINSTFCQVLAQLPADDVELAHIRGELGCKQRGLSPAQMKELAKTGGTK